MKITGAYLSLLREIEDGKASSSTPSLTLNEYYDPADILVIEDAIHKSRGISYRDIFEKLWNSVSDDKRIFRTFFIVKRKFIVCKGDTYMFTDHLWKPLTNPNMIQVYLQNYYLDDARRLGLEDNKGKEPELSKEAYLYLHSEKFCEALNKGNFIRFVNGVYDVDMMMFRDGLPSDFITLSTDTIFLEMDRDHQDKELDNLLEKLFPDLSVKEYFLCYMASCLEGRNRNKIFCIWQGVGSNGKSALVSLIENSFGSYVCKSPTSLFTGKRSASSSATPELLALEDKLISFVQESDSKEGINIGTLKELTGNDTIYVRGLYSTPKNIVVKCKFILVTNRVYALTGADDAAWARIRIIPFESTFIKEKEFKKISGEASEKTKNTYIMDTRFVDDIKRLAPSFIRRLVKYYENSRRGVNGYDCVNLPYCEKVEKVTEDLKFQNSPVCSFVKKVLEEKNTSHLNIETAFDEFKLWGRQYYNVHSYTIADFTNDLKRLGIEILDNVIIGYKMAKPLKSRMPSKAF